MDLITSRIFISLTSILLSVATQPLFAGCSVVEYDIEPGQSIIVPLSPHISGHIERQNESIGLDVQNGTMLTHRTKLESDWAIEPDWGMHQILAIDVNNDGMKELLIGLGRGMVNSYYTMLIFHLDGTLHSTVEVSDPEFCKTDRGFQSWHRSGPRGIDTYWAINQAGIPYRQITQTIVDDVVSHRVVHAEDGSMVTQSIVPNELDIHTTPVPFVAAIAASDSDVAVNDSKDSQREIAQIPAGTSVVLLGTDNTYSLFLIEYSQGKRGWIALEDVTYN